MRFLPCTLCLIVTAHATAAVADGFPFRLPENPREKTPEVVTLRSLHLRNAAVREEIVDPSPVRERPVRERWTGHFETAKGGFKYQDNFWVGDRRYRFSVRGPVQKNRSLGLTFEFRF
jgi:hypothetical protein